MRRKSHAMVSVPNIFEQAQAIVSVYRDKNQSKDAAKLLAVCLQLKEVLESSWVLPKNKLAIELFLKEIFVE